jgi:hypothetical protein
VVVEALVEVLVEVEFEFAVTLVDWLPLACAADRLAEILSDCEVLAETDKELSRDWLCVFDADVEPVFELAGIVAPL